MVQDANEDKLKAVEAKEAELRSLKQALRDHHKDLDRANADMMEDANRLAVSRGQRSKGTIRYWRQFITSAPLSSMPVHAEPLCMRTNVVDFRVMRTLYRRE